MRRYRPYQLEDRVEQLFHEKSVTAYSAWNRQFDATIANLRFKVGGKSLAIEPTLNLMQDRSGAKRKVAADALAKTFKENVRQFALITNTLAKDKEIGDRWRGFADIADDRHCRTGSNAKWWMPWLLRCAPLIRGCRIVTTR